MASTKNDLEARIKRANEKLKFALIHLEELQGYEANHENRRKLEGDGGSWQMAHQESFMFHLLGVLDAFYQELNVRFSLGVLENKVGEKELFRRLKASKPDLVKFLEGLKDDSTSWLAQAREMRNHTTHRARLSRTFSASTITNHATKQYLHYPQTQKESPEEVLSQFKIWHSEMSNLINSLRKA